MQKTKTSHSEPQPAPSRLSRGRGVLRILRNGAIVAGVGAIVMAAATAFYINSLIVDTPDISHLPDIQEAKPSVMLAADGTELTRFRRMQREWVPLQKISPHVVNALIATEDHRFHEHNGIDFGRTVAALFHTVTGTVQGGSTITQQLARNLFPEEIGRSRNADRKLKEMITAVRIEQTYSKQQVLETYLNTVPFLYNVFGIEMAARTYFSKSAAELGPLESATLVGMLKGTHYYNPVVNPERARARRNVVLGQMVKHGQLTQAQFQTLQDDPLQLSFKRLPEQNGEMNHFTEHVRKWVTNWAEQNNADLYEDGLIIQTTLDPELQEVAEQAVATQLDALQAVADVEWAQKTERLMSNRPSAYAAARKKMEPFRYFWASRPDLLDSFVRESAAYRKAIEGGAADATALAKLKADTQFMQQLRADKTRLETGFVAMDPDSGEVRAWVGSRDFARDQFDHVAQALRQPGSTFKPFVYGAALESGFSPGYSYLDEAVEIESADGEIWAPTDMSAPSGRSMSLREGLIYSKNTITAQVMNDVGLPSIVDLAEASGIPRGRLKAVPSLALGTSPVTLLEMVSGYSTIARSGEFRPPVFVKRIVDRRGKVLAEFGTEKSRVMSESTAVELIDMMRGVVGRGTGQEVRSRFNVTADVAGKTGTTQNNTDGWFILMHPNLVAGSWVGFNDSRVTMRSNHWGQGGHNALLVVGDFFQDALKEKLIDAKAKFPKPKRPVMMAREAGGWQDLLQSGGSGALTSGSAGIVVRRDANGTTMVGDAQGIEMLERDPALSAQMEARRAVDSAYTEAGPR